MHLSPGWWLKYWEIAKCVGAVYSYLSCLAKRTKKGRNHFITGWIHCPVQRVSWRELTWVVCSAMSFRIPLIDNGLQELDSLSTMEAMALTPSMPWCHLKTAIKSAKFETLKPLRFLFHTGMWKDFIKTRSSIERKMYCLQAHPSIFQPGKFTDCGSDGGKCFVRFPVNTGYTRGVHSFSFFPSLTFSAERLGGIELPVGSEWRGRGKEPIIRQSDFLRYCDCQ